MPHRKPFAWLILVGVCCSFTGMLRAWSDVSAAESSVPAPRASALARPAIAPSNAVLTIVTQVPRTTAAQGAVAAAIATPTPSAPAVAIPEPLAAPVDRVASLPAAMAPALTGFTQDPAKAAALFDLMNGARAKDGLALLERDGALDAVALARARNLITNGYFDHYAPDGESAFSELAARGIRYRLAGENLARNNYIETRTVQAAFEGLMGSPGHRANILEERFAQAGIAAVQSGHMWVYVTVFKD